MGKMSDKTPSFIDRIRENRDYQFYILYTVLYLFIILLTDIVNDIVGNNYGWNDVHQYWLHAENMFNGIMPYEDDPSAYPPLAFFLDLIPYIITPTEPGYNYSFAIMTYLFSLLAIHGLLKFCDSRGISHFYVYFTFALLIIGVNNFFIARNDTITTVFVVLSILFYLDRKYVPAFILLALGIMTKIYPIFLLPILLIPFLARKDLKSFFMYGALTALVCFVIELPVLINDPSTAFSYLTQHSGRGVEIESVVAIPLMIVSLIDDSLVYVGMDENESWDLFGTLANSVEPYIMPITFLIIGAFIVYFLYKMYKNEDDSERSMPLMLLACGIVLMIFMTFNKVFCAQYVMWIVMIYPFLVYSFKSLGADPKRLRIYLILLCAASLLTVLFMGDVVEGESKRITVQYILADTLKGAIAIILTCHLLKTLIRSLKPAQD